MLPTKDPPQDKRLQNWKGKGWKQISPKGQDSNTYITQNRLQNKGHKKRHRRTLHNTQEKNPSRRYKHICTQHRSTQIYKEKFGGLQERYRQQHAYSRGH